MATIFARISRTWNGPVAGTLELSITMGDYVLAGIMLITADHQLPPNRPALLPAR